MTEIELVQSLPPLTIDPSEPNYDQTPEEVAESIAGLCLALVRSAPFEVTPRIFTHDASQECASCYRSGTFVIEVPLPGLQGSQLFSLCDDHHDSMMRALASKLEAIGGTVTADHDSPPGYPGGRRVESV